MRSLGVLNAAAALNTREQRPAKRVKVDTVTVPARTKRPRKAKEAAMEKMAKEAATEKTAKQEAEEEEKKKEKEEEKKKEKEEKKKEKEEKKKEKEEKKKEKEEKKKEKEEKKKEKPALKAVLQQARTEAAKEFATKAKEASETAKRVGEKVTRNQMKTLCYLKMKVAAATLGISDQTLMKRYRGGGFEFWPCRTLHALELLMATVAADESRGDERQAILEQLRKEKEIIQEGQKRKMSTFATSLQKVYASLLHDRN